MISVAEALDLLERESAPLEITTVPLAQAGGRVLAQPVAADRDFPPTDRSAMDGFAVRAADVVRRGAVLELVGEVRAGQPLGQLRLEAGQAARIMTGGIVPPGADAIVMVEKTAEVDGGRRVRIDDEVRRGQHVRVRGQDLACGRQVLEPGTPIRAAEIATLASVGQASVRVHATPVVHVLATGDEIVEPDRRPQEHQVRNSNAHALLGQLAEAGIAACYLGIAGDEPQPLRQAIVRGLAGDLLLITGGVSVGRYDLVHDALCAEGMRLLFHGVSMKPGKPLLAGRCGRCLVLGLPGNPLSTFTCFVVFVAPVLRRLLGHRRWSNRCLPATLDEPLDAPPGRETYHLARLEQGADGLVARVVPSTGSGDVLALARANAFIVTPRAGACLAAGAVTPVLPVTFQGFPE